MDTQEQPLPPAPPESLEPMVTLKEEKETDDPQLGHVQQLLHHPEEHHSQPQPTAEQQQSGHEASYAVPYADATTSVNNSAQQEQSQSLSSHSNHNEQSSQLEQQPLPLPFSLPPLEADGNDKKGDLPDANEIKAETVFNPWVVESLDHFLFYCCPECNFRSQEHEEFNSHAIIVHPLVSKQSILGYARDRLDLFIF